MPYYRKKPVVIEAMPWTGDNYAYLSLFCTKEDETCAISGPFSGYVVKVQTPNGTTQALVGDYIIKGVEGEFYPCKPDIFEKTYDPVPDPA